MCIRAKALIHSHDPTFYCRAKSVIMCVRSFDIRDLLPPGHDCLDFIEKLRFSGFQQILRVWQEKCIIQQILRDFVVFVVFRPIAHDPVDSVDLAHFKAELCGFVADNAETRSLNAVVLKRADSVQFSRFLANHNK